MAPLPDLIHDAIAEILLRLPPDDPACLVRASVVCKLWRRILSCPTFPHRYREFHRTPPLLGFVRSTSGKKHSRFVPITTRTPLLQPAFGFRRCRALDCRHGRLIFDVVCDRRERLIVWDPITGDDKLLSDPDPRSYYRSGVVLCAVAGCNHRGCHGGPFLVVFVTTSCKDDGTSIARAWLFSSESAAWSAPTSVQIPYHSFVRRKRAAIVGDQLHFLLNTSAGIILKYDLGKKCFTTIGMPAGSMYTRSHILMTMEDGSSLGFVSIKDSTLHLWARKMNPNGSMGWVQDKVILLNNLVPLLRTADTYKVNVIGFVEGLDILLLGKHPSSFMFSLKSGKIMKLSNKYDYEDVFPYISFYIPDFASCKLPLRAETDEA